MALLCANIKFFTLVLCVLALSNITLYMYRVGVLTTIEQRFGFSASQLGLTLSMYEVGCLPSVLLLSYFGRKSHIPRILAVGSCFVAAAGLLMALPHSIYGSGTDRQNETSTTTGHGGLCVNISMEPTATSSAGGCGAGDGGSGMRYPVVFALLVMSSISVGISFGPIGTLGLAFIDNNVPDRKRAPLYIGIVNGTLAFGSFVGFLLAAMTTRIYVNPGEAWPPPDSPRWLGAWWLGAVITAVLAATTIVPFFLFPRSLVTQEQSVDVPEKVEQELTNISEHNKEDSGMISNKPPKGASGVLAGMKRLFTNTLFITLLFSMAIDQYFWSGIVPYIPKYVEAQFRMETYRANLLSAVMSGLAAAIGTLLGGVVASRITSERLLTRFMLAVSIISTSGLFPTMLLSCDPPPIIMDNSLECNANCSCSTSEFSPVCGSSGVDYKTPCFAGCTTPPVQGTVLNFTSCACLKDGWATAGACDVQCNVIYAYAVILFALCSLCNLNATPVITLILRVVDEDMKPFALGVMTAAMSLFAYLPGPAIFGAVVDTLCIIWQEDECGSRGSCFTYDVAKFRYAIHGLTGIFKAFAVLGYVYICFRFNTSNEPYVDKDVNGNATTKKE